MLNECDHLVSKLANIGSLNKNWSQFLLKTVVVPFPR